MSHKLQKFPPENDVQNSVVRNESSSQPKIASNDAGFGSTASPQDQLTRRDSRARESSGSGAVGAALPTPQASPRCDVARSAAYDPTGENAVACGAPAQLLCEHCGPICSSCADETFCFYGEHKLSPLSDADPPAQLKSKRPVNQVVYVEIKCPNCRRVRLALPKNHCPKARRKCPICKKDAPAEYLAHGFTRRRLPYHELFEIPDRHKETVLPDGKRRLPWDTRDLMDYKE